MYRFIIISLMFFLIFSCSENKQETSVIIDEARKQEYMQKGAEIAALTQAELLKNVSAAMQKGGPGYAVAYCNMRALYLKDSLSQKYNCQIRRLALRYRNPVDMPQTESETAQLNAYQQAFDAGQTLQPGLTFYDDRIEYYQPIMIAKEACLKCHGQPGTEIADATMAIIKERYPADKATGFAMNDLRGVWKITFNK